jgi:hypothetical protein
MATPPTWDAPDKKSGPLQQCPQAARLEAEFYGIRNHAAQFADLDLNGKDTPASRMVFTDFDDPLGYGQFVHNLTSQEWHK